MEKLSEKKNVDALTTSTKASWVQSNICAVGGNPALEYQTDVRRCRFDINLGRWSRSYRRLRPWINTCGNHNRWGWVQNNLENLSPASEPWTELPCSCTFPAWWEGVGRKVWCNKSEHCTNMIFTMYSIPWYTHLWYVTRVFVIHKHKQAHCGGLE